MMKDTAVIICNYNGGDATIKCINAVRNSQDVSFDIYVIDNASEDGSPEQINAMFEKQVTVVRNLINLGGSGGFGRGLRMAVEKGYSYIMLLDNDAYVGNDTIGKLKSYLDENASVGIVGAKIMMADDSERIMDYAKTLDFCSYIDGSKWCGQLDSEEACTPRECDFVAATAAMVRRDALIKCGGMDEAHFIYYDDIEMCYRIKLSGFRVVSLGNARAWHDSGMRRKVSSTFARYYLTRNRLRFFARYISESEIERFAEYILSRAFSYMYGSHYKERWDIFNTEKYILDDFIRDKRGMAGEKRINQIQTDGYHKIEAIMSGLQHICLVLSEENSETSVVKFCRKMWQKEPKAEIVINTDYISREKAQSCQNQVMASKCEGCLRVEGGTNQESYDKVIYFCGHVKDMDKNVLPDIYIDSHENIIANEQDYMYFRNYDNSYAFFKSLYFDSVICSIYKIRQGEPPCWE